MKRHVLLALVGIVALSVGSAWAGTGPGMGGGMSVWTGMVQSITPETGDLQSFVISTIVPPGMGMPSRLITVNVNATTQYFVNGVAGASTDVTVGAKVLVQLQGFNGTAGTALRVAIATPPTPRPAVVMGIVQSLTPETGDLQSFVVQPPTSGMMGAPAPVTVSVTADTQYFLGDAAATAADVKVGSRVVAQLTSLVSNAGTAVKVVIAPPKPPMPTVILGVVQSLTPETGDLQSFVVQPPANGMKATPAPVTVNVTADTQYLLGGAAATAADVKVGSRVVAKLIDFASGAGTAVQVVIQPIPLPVTVVQGIVKSITPETGDLQSFVVQRPKRMGVVPPPVTVTVTADTKYFVNDVAAAAADVQVGVRVVARLTGFASNAGTALRVNITPVTP